MAFVVPSPARAQVPDDAAGSESLWTRDTLGGEWGGLRHALGQYGTRFDLWATGFHQGMFTGTGDDDWEVGGRVDLLIDSDTGKLGLWQGGGLHAHVTYRDGDLPGSRGGALWPVHTSGSFPLGSKGDVVATSLHLSQRFGDSTRLLLGKINAIDLLARHPFLGGWGTDRFWNVAFVAPPSGVVPPVIMGGIFTHVAAPYTLTGMVFDPNDQTTNDSFKGLFDDGVNVSLGLSWAGQVAGRRSGTGITATYSTAERADLSQVGLPPALQTSHKKGSYNVTAQVSHLLVESTRVRGQGLGLYAQAAVADGNPNPIRRSFDQIDVEIREGKPCYQAVLDASVSRARPVFLGAATTVLGVAPLLVDPFFRSMAVTIMFGLIFATGLTLVVVPLLYAVFFRIRVAEQAAAP